jgi:NAD-dependent DNA ligase
MAREDKERRTKHRQDVSGSSSHALIAKTMKLAKRPRPSSYQEKSFPEASPPHGDTPYEMECLKMYSPEVRTNQEIMNYSKEDPMNVTHLCNKPCYSLFKERCTDERFLTFFHQDWYQTMLYQKTSLVVKYQWVNIDYMRQKKDMHFNRILEACGLHGITDLLQFRHN